MTFFRWSRISASNGTADATCTFPENMPASALNDGCRGMMAAASKYRDDTAGAIVTGGTATAYTVGTFEGFDTLLNLANQVVAFTPHATNGATVTLNVDGLGVKPLRSAPGVELPAGSLIQGTPYVALYNNSDAVWYLHGGVGAPNAYSIPLGAGMDFWGPTAPGSNFALAQGQAISRAGFAPLFAMFGTTFGVGDGSTTFNLPDKRGRVSAAADAGAGRLGPAGLGGNGAILGIGAGAETQTLTAAQIPSITSANGAQAISVTSTANNVVTGTVLGNSATAASATRMLSNDGTQGPITSTGSNSISVTSSNTGGGAHPNVQPTIVCNYIIRVL